jgi:hypothetical protein
MTQRMLRRSVYASCILAIAVTCVSGSNLYQYRFGAGLQWGFHSNWTLAVQQDFRYTEGNDLGFYYRATDVGLLYTGLLSWLDVGLNFKTVFAEGKTHETFRQDRPYVSVALKGNLKGLKINNRALVAYHDNEAVDDFWAFRNRFRLKYPVKAGTWEIAPYMEDELFFYFNDTYEDFKSNRIKAGVTTEPAKIFTADLYYFWERGEAYTLQAFGGSITLRF